MTKTISIGAAIARCGLALQQYIDRTGGVLSLDEAKTAFVLEEPHEVNHWNHLERPRNTHPNNPKPRRK